MVAHVHDTPGPWTIGVGIAVLVLAVGYVREAWRRWALGSPIPAWRVASFFAGLASALLAVASPIGTGDERLLTFHMVQHLLLMTVAPPLIFLGEPVSTLWRHPTTGPRRARATLSLAVYWIPATATLIGWHIPAAFAVALRSQTWHAVEQASFLLAGLLFWWPVVQPWPSRPEPRWSIVLYLFLATLPCDILSGFLVFSDRVAYSVYLSTGSRFTALADQQCAGAVMWTCVTVVYLVAGMMVSTQLLVSPTLREPLAEIT
jgi:cytochrome c oxidase assembly factor CtaG